MNALAEMTFAAPLLAAARWEAQALLWVLAFVLLVVVLRLASRAAVTSVACVAILVGSLVVVAMQISTPLVTGVMVGALGLLLSIPPNTAERRLAGGVYLTVAAGFLIYVVVGPHLPLAAGAWAEWIVLGLLATVTVGSSLAMISSRSAVYSAIWFALALLGTGGLFLYQGALFLGVATVVVYAGAIVVTFLFVIMLAQPEGHTAYDRISWGWFAKPAAVLAGTLMLGAIVFALQNVNAVGMRDELLAAAAGVSKAREATGAEPLAWSESDILKAGEQQLGATTRVELLLVSDAAREKYSAADRAAVAEEIARRRDPQMPQPVVIEIAGVVPPTRNVRSAQHMASFGGYLFSRQLIAVEVAGTLLLAALVGAVAMLSQGNASSPSSPQGRRPAARGGSDA